MHRGNINLSFIDLFAGCGGFSLGLEAAGFSGFGSVEIDAPTQKTLQANFGPSKLHSIRASQGDIRKLDPHAVRRELAGLGIDDLDLLVAC